MSFMNVDKFYCATCNLFFSTCSVLLFILYLIIYLFIYLFIFHVLLFIIILLSCLHSLTHSLHFLHQTPVYVFITIYLKHKATTNLYLNFKLHLLMFFDSLIYYYYYFYIKNTIAMLKRHQFT